MEQRALASDSKYCTGPESEKMTAYPRVFFLAACSWAVPVANLCPSFCSHWERAARMCGPADVCDTHKVRLFSLEPTLPARPAHYTHVVGRLHVRHGPTRLAHVDRADRVYEAASGSSRCSLDIYNCSQPRAEGRHGFLTCHYFTLRPYSCTCVCAFRVSRARLECLSW